MRINEGETVKSALAKAQKYLGDSVEKDEAALLVCQTAGLSKEALYVRPETTLTKEQAARLGKILKARRRGVPVQYIFGRADFYGRSFAVRNGVFIPRPETELLVDVALGHALKLAQTNGSVRILDLCAGSGAVAVTLAQECPGATVTAVDKSRKACEAVRYNAANLGAGGHIEVIRGDLFNRVKGKYDIITCNPPYITGADMKVLQQEVKKEPKAALYGGKDGLAYYRRLAAEAPCFLAQNGVLVMEMGYNQAEDVRRIFGGRFQVKIHEDFAAIPRIAEANIAINKKEFMKSKFAFLISNGFTYLKEPESNIVTSISYKREDIIITLAYDYVGHIFEFYIHDEKNKVHQIQLLKNILDPKISIDEQREKIKDIDIIHWLTNILDTKIGTDEEREKYKDLINNIYNESKKHDYYGMQDEYFDALVSLYAHFVEENLNEITEWKYDN